MLLRSQQGPGGESDIVPEALRPPLRRPPHPGETLREDVLPALELTVTQAAQELLECLEGLARHN